MDAPCAFFGSCGGCKLQSLAYDHQVRHKGVQVRDIVRRIRYPPTPPPRDTSHARSAASACATEGDRRKSGVMPSRSKSRPLGRRYLPTVVTYVHVP